MSFFKNTKVSGQKISSDLDDISGFSLSYCSDVLNDFLANAFYKSVQAGISGIF